MKRINKLQFLKDFVFNRNFAVGLWLVSAAIFGISQLLRDSMNGNTVWKVMHYGSIAFLLLPIVILVTFIIIYPFGLAYEDALDKQQHALPYPASSNGFAADAAALRGDMDVIGNDFVIATKKILKR